MKVYRLSFSDNGDFVNYRWFSSYTTARSTKTTIKKDGYKPLEIEQFDTGKGREGLLNFLNDLEASKN